MLRRLKVRVGDDLAQISDGYFEAPCACLPTPQSSAAMYGQPLHGHAMFGSMPALLEFRWPDFDGKDDKRLLATAIACVDQLPDTTHENRGARTAAKYMALLKEAQEAVVKDAVDMVGMVPGTTDENRAERVLALYDRMLGDSEAQRVEQE